MAALTRISGDGQVARRYGLEEAIFLDSMVFWYRTNRGDDRNFYDGRWWSHNSMKAYEQIFPWWSAKQLRRIIESCKAKGALLSGNYNKDRRDRTYWYSPSDEVLALYGEAIPGKCNCPNGQMQEPEGADSCAQMGEPLPCRNSRAVPLSEMLRDFTARMRDKTPPKYLTWGMETLDKRLYAELGDLIVLGGHASSGKTLLSLLFALHQAREYRVGYYSLETSAQKIADRLVAAHAPVALSDIKRHALTAPDWVATAELVRREEQTSFEYINAAGMTVPDISAMALSRRHQVVYVDYLQKLQARGQNRFELVTSVSSDLQRMAKAHGIAVVALSQLSRAQKTKSGAWIPPSMSDFRESGQIEQDADVAMLLWPEDMNDYRSNRILKIGKNKEGTKTDLTLEFDGLHQTMREIPKDNSRAVAAQMSAVGRAAKQGARAKANMEQMQFSPLSGEDPDMPF